MFFCEFIVLISIYKSFPIKYFLMPISFPAIFPEEMYAEYVKIGRDKKPMKFEVEDKILQSITLPAAV